MERYGNSSGNSAIVAFEAGDTFIRIKFRDGDTYVYTHDTPGWNHVERMKILARQGSGLLSYINRNVGASYERKET